MASPAWTSRSAWAGLLEPGAFGAPGAAGLTVAPREDFGLASLIVAPGGEAALAALIADRLGATLPAGPGFATGHGGLVLWSGPRHWLLVLDRRADLDAMGPALAEACALSDQSESRGILHLAGPRVREVLAKGVPVDLDPTVFRTGSAAATLVSHVGVQLWQVDDAPTYDLAVPRSQAGTIWSWLVASAAEYGVTVAAWRRVDVDRCSNLTII